MKRLVFIAALLQLCRAQLFMGAHSPKCANGCGRTVSSVGQTCNYCSSGR